MSQTEPNGVWEEQVLPDVVALSYVTGLKRVDHQILILICHSRKQSLYETFLLRHLPRLQFSRDIIWVQHRVHGQAVSIQKLQRLQEI